MKGEKSLDETVEDVVRAKCAHYDNSFTAMQQKHESKVTQLESEYRARCAEAKQDLQELQEEALSKDELLLLRKLLKREAAQQERDEQIRLQKERQLAEEEAERLEAEEAERERLRLENERQQAEAAAAEVAAAAAAEAKR
jgi:gentisate 1,2-dioxygenase